MHPVISPRLRIMVGHDGEMRATPHSYRGRSRQTPPLTLGDSGVRFQTCFGEDITMRFLTIRFLAILLGASLGLWAVATAVAPAQEHEDANHPKIAPTPVQI